jgi:sulfur relay (sulfurtransferase) complex TusBCD TusD component (DsrE family)
MIHWYPKHVAYFIYVHELCETSLHESHGVPGSEVAVESGRATGRLFLVSDSVTDTNSMFERSRNFNDNISQWDTHHAAELK